MNGIHPDPDPEPDPDVNAEPFPRLTGESHNTRRTKRTTVAPCPCHARRSTPRRSARPAWGERRVPVTHKMTTETNRSEGRTDDKTTPTDAAATENEHGNDNGSASMLSVAQLTGFQRDILWTLSHRGGADYGLGVKDALEAYRDEPINHGRLYPNLDSLKNKGFLTKSPLDRRTNQYALTDEAFGALADRARWQTGDENGPVGGSVER